MADRLQTFVIAVPAGTLASALQKTDVSFFPGIVRLIEVFVPDGPRGNSGFQLGQAQQATLPRNVGTYIVANNEVVKIDNPEATNTGNWQFYAYNVGGYLHHYWLRFHVDELALPAPHPLAALVGSPMPASVIETPPGEFVPLPLEGLQAAAEGGMAPPSFEPLSPPLAGSGGSLQSLSSPPAGGGSPGSLPPASGPPEPSAIPAPVGDQPPNPPPLTLQGIWQGSGTSSAETIPASQAPPVIVLGYDDAVTRNWQLIAKPHLRTNVQAVVGIAGFGEGEAVLGSTPPGGGQLPETWRRIKQRTADPAMHGERIGDALLQLAVSQVAAFPAARAISTLPPPSDSPFSVAIDLAWIAANAELPAA